MRYRGPLSVLLLLAIALLGLAWPLESNIERAHDLAHPNRPLTTQGGLVPVGGVSEGGLFQFLQAAGMNALLADLLWMKADDLWHSASWWQMAPVMEAIVKIDPKFVLVWRVLAWHYGWNLYIAASTEVERQQWLQKSEDAYYRAVQANPNDYDLYSDMCWFFTDKVRREDKAVPLLEEGVKKFPIKGIETVERQLQRVYERTWRVNDAMNVIKDIAKKRPDDPLARRDMEWWTKYKNDENWRWILEEREDVTRASHDLPPFLNSFEGQTMNGVKIAVPPWRDMSQPDYRNPKWTPQIWQFPIESVARLFSRYPELQKQWAAHHPGVPTTEPKAIGPSMPMPNPSDPMNGPIRQYMSRKITYKELMKQFGGYAPTNVPQPGPDGYAPKGSRLNMNPGAGRMGPGMGPGRMGMGRMGMGPGMGRGPAGQASQ